MAFFPDVGLPLPGSERFPEEMVQAVDQWRDEMVRRVPFLDGRFIEDVELSAHSANDVEHKLGRKLRGWRLVRSPFVGESFHVTLNSTDTGGAVASTPSTVAYDTEEHDTHGVIAAGIFTAPRDGLYSFVASVEVSSLADGDDQRVELVKNNTTAIASGEDYPGASASHATQVVANAIRLSKDDTVRVKVTQSNASNQNIAGDPKETYFMGRAIDELGDAQSELSVADQAKYLRLYSSCKRTVSLWVF